MGAAVAVAQLHKAEENKTGVNKKRSGILERHIDRLTLATSLHF
jgi:hypothetical protein